MYLAYTDDSGDSGYLNSPTDFFVLSCVLVHELQWQGTLDAILQYRRKLHADHGIAIRQEIKAEHFVYGRGPFRGWGRPQRLALYKEFLEFERDQLDVQVFAIAIAKRRIENQAGVDARERAWSYLAQRIDTFCGKAHLTDRVMLLPDEGHGHLVQKIMRKARRFQTIAGHYGGVLDIRARYLVEDPFEKGSDESLFIQLADLNAYAAHRYGAVAPNTKIPTDLWDSLGDIRLKEVNSLAGGPNGIVVWPRN